MWFTLVKLKGYGLETATLSTVSKRILEKRTSMLRTSHPRACNFNNNGAVSRPFQRSAQNTDQIYWENYFAEAISGSFRLRIYLCNFIKNIFHQRHFAAESPQEISF